MTCVIHFAMAPRLATPRFVMSSFTLGLTAVQSSHIQPHCPTSLLSIKSLQQPLQKPFAGTQLTSSLISTEAFCRHLINIMPSALRGADKEQLQLRDVSTLRQTLGFTGMTEFKAFLESKRFKPYFDEYASQWIIPQQERARAQGSNRPRGVGLEHVEKRLLSGERPGQDKFSCRRPDKSNWDDIDHCALMLFEIREANTKSVEGLFYRTNLSEHDIHIRIWALVKYVEFNTAPSRKKRKATDDLDPNVGTGDLDPNVGTGDLDPNVGTGDLDPNVGTPNIFVEGDPGPNLISVGTAEVQFPPADDDTKNNQILNFLNDDDGIFVGNRALSNAERLCFENDGQPFDITSRFWKAWVISEVVGSQDDLSKFRSRVDYASNLDAQAVADQALFHQEMTKDLEEDLILIPEFTEPMRTLHDQQQTWLDNPLFQREDLEDACKVLSIPWEGEKTIFRAPHMSLSTQLEIWQPVAVKAIIDFTTQEPALGGCILADMMGLGKTWVTICFLLWVGALTVPVRRRLQDTIAYCRSLPQGLLLLVGFG